jgi:hypothetical protein
MGNFPDVLNFNLLSLKMLFICESMIGENRQLVAYEPVEFEK